MPPSADLLTRLAPLSPVPGCPDLLLHQAEDVFALWQAWEDEQGAICEVPYWAVVWPAAQVLARHIAHQPALVAGRRVLDCGCGGGLVALAAARYGARRSAACDLDETAVWLASQNARANDLTIDLLCQDAITACDPRHVDLILVADLFYQRQFAARLFTALRQAFLAGCQVLIADSGRPFLPKEELVEIAVQTVATSFDVEGCESREVRLYRFR